jgi:hypothetical protein
MNTPLLSLSLLTLASLALAAAPTSRPATQPGTTQVPIVFTGGYDTDPRDHGRPVTLVAAGLNVPPDTFRTAFSGVTPAPAGQEPDPAQVRLNKQALLRVLGPLGVTNDRLDTVSNYYRYRPGNGNLWTHTPAAATATLKDGAITAVTLTNPGAGYTTPPRLSIPNHPDARLTATLTFTTDLAKNGSIRAITLTPPTTQPAKP